MNEKIDFCTHCRKETEYTLQKRDIVRTINGIEHTFSITVAICNECGEEMSLPGLIDKNISEFKEQIVMNKDLVKLKNTVKYVMSNLIKYEDNLSLEAILNIFNLERYGFPKNEELTTEEMLEILDIKYTYTDNTYLFNVKDTETGKLIHLTYDGTYLYIPHYTECKRVKYFCPISTLLFVEIMYVIGNNKPIADTIKKYFNLATE